MERERAVGHRAPARNESERENGEAAVAAGGARARLVSALPVEERRWRPVGISTAVLEGGEGPPIVLLHGPGESSLWWMRVIPGLTTTHHVIAPDLPGHGATATTDDPLDTGRVLEWLDELIERSCSSPPTLVGHLLGGAIAARFASDRSERLRRLVLVDTFGLRWLRPAPGFAWRLLRFLLRPTERTHRRFFPQCVFDPDDVRAQMGELWQPFLAYSLDRARAPEGKEALRVLMRGMGLPKIPTEDLARIAVPTSLIWGRHDRATPLRVAEEASARHGWPLHVIEEARDDPKLERPDAFLDVLRELLSDPGSNFHPAGTG